MSDLSKIAIIKDLLDSANNNIQEARSIISQLTGDIPNVSPGVFVKQALSTHSPYQTGEGERIIEGIFNGEHMIDSEGATYPVPVNYASKSKLVSGDKLKLTIQKDGRFLYKQIGPVERKYLVGPLSFENGQYKVFANGRAYRVLLASVTYYKAEVGDELTIIIPDNSDTEWATIDAVLPKYENVVKMDMDSILE